MLLRDKLALGIVLSTAFGTANAGSATGQIASLRVNGANMVLSIAGAELPVVTCNSRNVFIVSLSTTLGEDLFSTVTTAMRAGLTVTANGTGACGISPSGEDLVSVEVTGTP